MGAALEGLLEVLGLPGAPLPADTGSLAGLVDAADRRFSEGRSTVVLVSRGGIGTCPARVEPAGDRPLTRAEAVACVVDALPEDAVAVSTTGLISRELFASRDLPSNFYMQGSMGHAMAIGLGIALERSTRPVVVIDGDGAVLMHMGTLSTVGYYAPGNLVHVVLDNEAYESTGSQATTSARTRLEEVARACGYRSVRRCSRRRELRSALQAVRRGDGPAFVLVKVSQAAAAEPARVTTRYAPVDTTRRVSGCLAGDR